MPQPDGTAPNTFELLLAEEPDLSAALSHGWGQAEPQGRWTVGTSAIVKLPAMAPGRYQVTMALRPYLKPPQLESQRLRIRANGIPCFDAAFAHGKIIDFAIPGETLVTERDVELHLDTPDATAPLSLGDMDRRQLGFMVKSIAVAATIGPAPAPVAVPLKKAQQVAAVTMVYNETEYLPIWLKHYSRQVGLENCFIIDHGSDDGSTGNLGACNVIRIPRSPYDPVKQSKFNSEFCASLLNWFDWVAYSDVDELLMADPEVAATLAEYCRRPLPPVVTAIGLNTAHRLAQEPDLDFSRPVTLQRPYVFTASSMCKPTLISRAVTWSPGSHSSDAPLVFDHLYLFHLRWVDMAYGLRRLDKTRRMAWVERAGGDHQRVEDDKMTKLFQGFGRLSPIDGIDFNPASEPVKGYIDDVTNSQKGREGKIYKISLDIWARKLWRLPERFIGTF